MKSESYQYATITLQTTRTAFKDWLDSHLYSKMSEGQYFHISDNVVINHVPHFEYIFEGDLIYIKLIPKSGDEIEFTFWTTKYESSVEAHIKVLLTDILAKWSVATLPHGFSTIIKDNDVLVLLQNRWNESQRTYQAQAWLSTIVLLGSILECVLSAVLLKHSKKASTSSRVPINKKTKKLLNITEWKLQSMIEVAKDLNWISSDFKNFSHALREYRNLIHPLKQINMKEKGDVTPQMCRSSRETIRGVIEELAKNNL